MNEELTMYRKGDIAVAKSIARLTELEYDILLPTSMHLRYDLVIHKDNKFYKIQVKYTTRGECVDRTGQRISAGWVANHYQENDFDYYALYLPQIDTVIFPSIKFAGNSINFEPQQIPFWWYEDFLNLTDEAYKRIPEEFEFKNEYRKEPKPFLRKVERPSKEELEKMVWEKSTVQIAKDLGVSDVAVAKWCKYYGIEKPGRGHWAKQSSQ